VLPLGTPRKLASLPIGGASTKLSLGRVARVVQGHQPLIGNALIGGSPGLVLLVQKLPSASLIGVTNGVQRALSDLRPALPGVRIATSFFRPATYLSDSLHNLALGIVLAAVLGLIALAALLLEFRMAFVAALSIALSLIGALLVLQWLGQTLNALVVLGLLMASAVLVDDALGAAYELLRSVRHSAQRAGGPPLQATLIESLARLRGTMGYATIAVLLTIAPVFFSSGLTARYLHPMVLSLALAVITSAVIALTVTPALGMLVLERRSPRRAAAPPLADRIAAVYERMVRRATSVPIAVLGVVTLAGVAGIVSIPFLHQPAPPRFKDRNLVVQWSGPAGAGLGEMDRVTDRAMRELRALPAVAAVAATLGRAVGGDRIVDPSSGQIYIALKASANYVRALSEVRQIVLGTPGIEASVSTDEAERQAGVLAPAGDAVVVRVYGEDYERLDTIATRVQRAIATTPGLERPRVQGPSREPNIEVAIDDAAARRAGVLPGDARRQASALVSGLTVGNFFQDQAVFDVVVIGTPAVRRTVRDIGSLLIDTAHGGTVRLSRIAHVAVRPYPIDIRHQALSRYVDVVAPVRSGSAAAARAGVQTALGRMRFPLDYRAEVLGPAPEAATSHGVFVAFIIAAAVGIVLLLQAALSSWGLAAAMFLTLPVSLAGGLIVALATGQASSLAADAGLLAVLAFALRQGTAQVVTIRRLQGVHGSRLDRNVIARASLTRLAPSLAAAAVTATVMLPFIALGGNVAGNEITHTAAVVILGGLVSATLWTHLLLPAVCFVLAPPTPPPAEGELDVLIQQSTNGASAKTGAGEAFDSDNSSPSVQTLF
jgi:multidrug efflux pump subunit AcrB